jgi:hypothetical protein
MPARKTHKKRNSSRTRKYSAHTLPVLKQSFDEIEHEASIILKEIDNPKERVRKFQQVWRRVFGGPVEAVAAEAYLEVKGKSRNKNTRKRQKGGAAPIAGAPIDFQTRPGIDGVHGSYPQYLTSGLSFYNTINQDQLNKGVGLAAFEPAVPADMGSNQVGGNMITDAAYLASTRPVASVSPPSVINDLQTYLQGRSLGSSPDPTENPLKLM